VSTDTKRIVGKIVIDQEIDGKLVDDILCTAFEGGINYWCTKKVVVVGDDYHGGDYASEVVSRGGTLNIYDGEEERWHVLGIENMIEGIRQWCIKYGSYAQLLDDFDAGDADCIVQLALFGEVVYG
jgi:hypothetical protein